MSIKLKGSSDGSVSFDAPADTSPSGSDITLTLPTSAGSANQFLKNSGIAGELEYSSLVEDSSGDVGLGIAAPTWTSGGGLHLGDNHGIGFGDGGSGRPDFQLITTDGGRLDFRCGFGADDADISIDTSGRLLVNTTSNQDNYLVQVKDGDVSLTKLTSAAGGNGVDMLRFRVHNSANTSEDASLAGISAETVSNWGGSLTFHTKANNGSPNETLTERARLAHGGEFVVGKDSPSVSVNGGELRDGSSDYAVVATAGGHIPCIVNRNTNDGGLIRFRQNNSDEGDISVSGSTISYNGAHLSRWSQLAGGAERIEILRGSVLSNLDEMCEWGEEDNEQLNRMKVSDVEGDPNVSGVFQDWDDDDDTYINDFYCAMTGDFVIRIAQGTTVARGDLLMSAGDGTAKPQDDDIVRSKTIAKVTSTTVSTTYSDGSYCVPCVLMAC